MFLTPTSQFGEKRDNYGNVPREEHKYNVHEMSSSLSQPSRPLEPVWKERTALTHNSLVQSLTSTKKSDQENNDNDGEHHECTLLLGGSTLERWKTTGRTVWQEYEIDQRYRTVVNAGVGGDGTQHVLWRLTEGGLLDHVRPSKVILLIGSNNVERDSVEHISLAIERIIDLIQERYATCQIVLYGVLPRGDKRKRVKINAKINQLNRLLSEIRRPHLSYRNFGHKFLDEHGEWNEEYFDDHVHLNERAHREIYIHELLADLEPREEEEAMQQ